MTFVYGNIDGRGREGGSVSSPSGGRDLVLS